MVGGSSVWVCRSDIGDRDEEGSPIWVEVDSEDFDIAEDDTPGAEAEVLLEVFDEQADAKIPVTTRAATPTTPGRSGRVRPGRYRSMP